MCCKDLITKAETMKKEEQKLLKNGTNHRTPINFYVLEAVI